MLSRSKVSMPKTYASKMTFLVGPIKLLITVASPAISLPSKTLPFISGFISTTSFSA